jgi:hypothetical protein
MAKVAEILSKIKANPNRKTLIGGILLCALGMAFNGDQLINGANAWWPVEKYDAIGSLISMIFGASLTFKALSK